ncbi:16S rRNA (adenine(1518)-N(6)/adenine(1519)-N(6))-dimethyltransferase RsmA [Alphaproteobacteria bacterium]|nr:16S rRNA (adenine(1518)-N(6)/adenine(1519)-N(6))-dimethyltransferase RsmA [Alphaproteobacteria bacterium]
MSNNLKQLRSYNFKFKKSLGQNFLFDTNITDKIVKYSLPLSNTVIEIGPGAGTLTKSILKSNVKKIILIEKDKSLIKLLQNLEEKYNSIKIYNHDALKLPIWKLGIGPKEVIANLPYNISTKILTNLLKHSNQFTKLTMMFQKEVAKRIIAEPGTKSYSRISVISQLKTKANILFDVPDTAFFPKPKIHSSLVQFIPYEDEKYNFNFEKMEKLTRFVFSKKRKMLRTIFKKEGGSSFLNSININPNIRPENLTLDEFCKLEYNLK